MNRSGRSEPAGPAMMPHASSGWSARAWAMILSTRSREILSISWTLPKRSHQAVLEVGQPVIGDERRIPLVVLGHALDLLVDLLGDVQARAEREPYVVERAQPRLGLLGVEPDLPGYGGAQHHLGVGALAVAQARLRVPPELERLL